MHLHLEHAVPPSLRHRLQIALGASAADEAAAEAAEAATTGELEAAEAEGSAAAGAPAAGAVVDVAASVVSASSFTYELIVWLLATEAKGRTEGGGRRSKGTLVCSSVQRQLECKGLEEMDCKSKQQRREVRP